MHIEIEGDVGPRGILAVDGCEPRPFDGWLALLAELGEIFSDGHGQVGEPREVAPGDA